MRVLFELSGEHPTLPTGEILSLLEMVEISFRVIERSKVLIVDIDNVGNSLSTIANRLALSFYIDELWYMGQEVNDILDSAKRINLTGNSFSVRGKSLGMKPKNLNLMELEKKVGNVLSRKGTVDLKNPSTEIRILVSNGYYLCKKMFRVNRGQFEKRRVMYRPFFLPISLHPRLARALVNITGIKGGGNLMDPFCGTGGILLEGGLMGLIVTGSDIDKRMVEGCRKTMMHYGIKQFNVFQSDIENIPVDKKMDAVVSDFPYGRSTRISHNLMDLYDRAFHSISTVLKKNKKAVLGLPTASAIEIGKEYLDFLECYPYRVHKSLTRYFTVFTV